MYIEQCFAKPSLAVLSPRNLADPRVMMLAIKSYFDGTKVEEKAERPCITLAGVVGDENAWASLEGLWDEVRKERGNPPFIHMTDLMAGEGIYKYWKDDDRYYLVDGLLNVLLSFRGNWRIRAFTCSVFMDVYKRYSRQRRLPSPERLCARIVFPHVMEWYQNLSGIDVGYLEAYFDRSEGFIRHVYPDWTSKAIRKRHPQWELVSSMTQAEMERTTALQVADVVAWGRNRLESYPSADINDLYCVAATRAAGGLYWVHRPWNEQAFQGFNYREEGYAAIDPQRLKLEAKQNMSEEFKRFDKMMQQLLHTSHAELKAKLDAEKSNKQEKKRKTKSSASGRASRAKD